MISINFHSNFMKHNKALYKNNLRESNSNRKRTKHDNSLH